MNKRILLTGTYNSKNKGDAAMQWATAQELLKVSGVDVTLSSPFPEMDAPFYAPIKVVPASRRKLIRSTIKVLLRLLGITFADEESRAFNEADLIVDLSGDMLTESYGPHLAYSHFLPIWLAFAHGKPVFACAQSIGPFPMLGSVAKWTLSRCSRVTAREEISFELLRSFGFSEPHASQTGDMAFLLEPAAPPFADEILKALKIDTSRPLLGVCLSQLIIKSYHSSSSAFEQIIAESLDRFSESTGAQVLFVAHVTGPTKVKDDRIIARRVLARMKSPAFVWEADPHTSEVKAVIGKCDAFFSARMHANISALSQAVPALALAYSHKTLGIMRTLGQSEWILPPKPFTAEAITARLTALWAERNSIRQTLLERLPAVEEASRRNVRLITELLSK